MIRNLIKKVDPRVQPPEEEKKKFDDDCSRRYINVGIAMRDFFKGVADSIGDKDLLEYSDYITKSIYHRDKDTFDRNVRLYTVRLQQLGIWKEVKGLTKYQKTKMLLKLAGLGKKFKKQQEKENESK